MGLFRCGGWRGGHEATPLYRADPLAGGTRPRPYQPVTDILSAIEVTNSPSSWP
jgi:hypothetical protein